jgi:hypothetical protein
MGGHMGVPRNYMYVLGRPLKLKLTYGRYCLACATDAHICMDFTVFTGGKSYHFLFAQIQILMGPMEHPEDTQPTL